MLVLRMLHVTPDLESLFQRALQHHQTGQFSHAETLYRQILQWDPRYARSLHMLGALAARCGHFDEALVLIRQAIAQQPHFPDAYNNMGHILRQQGQVEEALDAFRQAIAQRPDYFDAHYNLGLALQEQGRLEAAAMAYRKAIELHPRAAAAYNNLGNVLGKLLQTDEAIRAYRQAIALQGDYGEAYSNLGTSLKEKGMFDEAVEAMRQGLRLRPDLVEGWHNLAGILTDDGELDQAVAAIRQCMSLRPEYAEAHSTLLVILHYHPGSDPQTLAENHRTWGRQHAVPLKRLILPHTSEPNPERRLRIGYVSPDFRFHSVAPMVLPLLANHDRRHFEIFCYARVPQPDSMTARFQRHADHWRDTVGLSDRQLADLIRRDGIDILVDLAGHTVGHRLLVFAEKPAPVQVTRQGYPNTTGLDTIDYRMTDALADPPGLADTLHTEKLLRLPQTNWIYQPPDEALALPIAPLDLKVPITFGCFNNFAKVTEPMLRLWAQILAAVPGSRLLLKAKVLAAASVQQRVEALFAAHGITSDRVQLVPWCPTTDAHLQLYQRMAIALDPFPYHGTTTTCEALWMGVPVITLAGQTHVSRVGVSLLTNVGLPELIAHTPEEYLRIAVALAGDHARLQELRGTLRQKLQTSPILDFQGFARNIERAYRDMWRKWCTATGPEDNRAFGPR